MAPDLQAPVIGVLSLVVGVKLWQTAEANDARALFKRARQGRRLYRLISFVILGMVLTELAWLAAAFGARAATIALCRTDDIVAGLGVWIMLALLHRTIVVR